MRSYSFAMVLAGALALPALAQDNLRRSVPAQPGGRLILRADVGSLEVLPGASNSVEVEVRFRGGASDSEFRRMLDDFSLDVTESGGEVRVTGRFVNGWESRAGFGSWFGRRVCHNMRCLKYDWLRGVEYHVTVPRQFSAALDTEGGSIRVGDLAGTVNVETSGGSLELGRIEGPVDAHTSGGSIKVRGAQGRALLRTSGGSIQLDDVAGDIDANTSGGSIQVVGATGNVRVHTSGGSISIGEPSGTIDASTSGGSIRVTVPSGRGFDIDASTSGGHVSTDFNVPPQNNRNQLRASVNGGGPTIRLRTSGGGISIQQGR